MDPNRAARIVIFIVAPQREAATYLQLVGAFARTLSDPETVTSLLAARTPEDVAGLAALAAVELPSQLLVRDIMTPHIPTVRPEQTLGGGGHLMVGAEVRGLPLLGDAPSLVGMITHPEAL